MAWFRKNKDIQSQSQEPEEETQVLVIEGDRPCSEVGCSAANGAPCSYKDRRGHACPTAWCPDHQAVVNGLCYCRRHANTLDAVGTATEQGFGLPDVTNRVPTLVRWIGLHIDESVHLLLESLRLKHERYSRIAVHPIRKVDGKIRWETTWQLYDHTGPVMKVSVEVNETEPTLVVVRVGQQSVYSEIPPWIMHRERHEEIDPEIDAREREVFYHYMLEAIYSEVMSQRQE